MNVGYTLNFRENPRFKNNIIETNSRYDRILLRNTYPCEFTILRKCTTFGKKRKLLIFGLKREALVYYEGSGGSHLMERLQDFGHFFGGDIFPADLVIDAVVKEYGFQGFLVGFAV